MGVREQDDRAAGDVRERGRDISRPADARVAEVENGERPGGGFVEDVQTARLVGAAPHAIEGELMDGLAESQGAGEGHVVCGDLVGKFIACHHPLIEIGGAGQEVAGLVATGFHGGDQVQGGVAAHEGEVHVTILTGDVRWSNTRHWLNR